MTWLVRLLALGLFLAALSWAPAAQACPNCKEAIASAGDVEDDDPLREARAYNYSIYFMVGMPYLLLGTVGFFIYRGLRTAQKKAEQNPTPPELPSA